MSGGALLIAFAFCFPILLRIMLAVMDKGAKR